MRAFGPCNQGKSPELQNGEIPDEIPAENGVQSDHYRVLAHFNLNGCCRGG
jgi:hypothetical protein